mmetsp:Transcript_20684/g.26697  ORF Transcript_20684/g.26697 Transcript_20684/m.26697 type:complete len:122 (-) Transcript_20684:142-507(-)|eukprot:CAMPEP_0198139562 /NCGR_PEP_ID=MMETSP1443-20131203/2844_1 /TAXON_ID=186043 /ORGANISM="Entomoneis sp., Strain CCMP2396" /LENGTH=121 /DNA_ID=CAMNT_0043801723 /DNA_START=62 /DNA_END=427 /DNA_ORIENTATION=+
MELAFEDQGKSANMREPGTNLASLAEEPGDNGSPFGGREENPLKMSLLQRDSSNVAGDGSVGEPMGEEESSGPMFAEGESSFGGIQRTETMDSMGAIVFTGAEAEAVLKKSGSRRGGKKKT